MEVKNESDSNSDEENDREVNDWDNNDMNSDEDKILLESKASEKMECITRSKARNLRSYVTFKCNDKRSEHQFKTRYRLKEPKNRHIGEYMCDSDGCKFIANSSAKLKVHKLRHSEERPNKCQYCDKYLKTKYVLEDHIKRRHPEECPDLPLLVCEVEGCGYQTKLNAGLNQHKRIHSHPFQCNVCHKRFARKESFENHEHIHSKDKSFKCDQCSKSFAVYQNLQIHINYLHNPNNNIVNDKKDEDDKELKSKPSKQNKFVTKSKARNIVRKYKTMKIIDKTKLTCTFPDCGAVLSSKKRLSYHMDIHSDETFKCSHKGCNEVFKTRHTLSSHKYKHLGRFKCDLDTCNFIGDCLSKLTQHKLSHSDERPIKCQYCDKRFKNTYGALRRHIERTHPDQCPELPLLNCLVIGCQFQTKSRDFLVRHKRNHSLPFECNVCHKSYARKDNFEYHINTHSRQSMPMRSMLQKK